MAEPKKRHTSTRSGNRRSHLAKKTKSLSICPKCKETTFSHRVCPNCGYYKGKDVLKLEEKTKAKEERRKEREKANEDSTNSK
ncbi:50S ribosomal protein L32 [Candidatus Berkelbacteria bacterium RBG_13_40_8]|uniref:Large ribosomal subunit protein bL32 n=1 Tax=Candidatus Berkelbacteria bacterium RBG_13_40_8 TaxID=1797467 RepID=A0A1F5DQB0_9BACT|nr:MAG: 50S ribosomal protein L32 [Candidatus Berkelbacteria bacterium RBG_13_40_8]